MESSQWQLPLWPLFEYLRLKTHEAVTSDGNLFNWDQRHDMLNVPENSNNWFRH